MSISEVLNDLDMREFGCSTLQEQRVHWPLWSSFIIYSLGLLGPGNVSEFLR